MNVDLRTVDAGYNRVAVLAYEARRPRDVTIVAAHGYSSSKQNLDPLCSFMASHGFAVFSLDFPGHKLGSSGGTLRTADDLVDAMAAVVEHARSVGAMNAPTYVLGHSMGAMTAILTGAADRSIAGVVSIATGLGDPAALTALGGKGAVDLRSSYVDGMSLPDLVAQVGPRIEPALDALAGRPQLFVAAERDMMVTQRSVRALYDRATAPKAFEMVASDHTYAGENSRSVALAWLSALHPRVHSA